MRGRLLVGTRGSKLALAQTRLAVEMLRRVDSGLELVSVPVKTMGDIMPPEKLGGVDGKSAFTSEIDRQLIEGGIDLAVHSMKDLPVRLDERLVVAATPEREDARDALVSESGMKLAQLRKGARIGTSSVRRRAQLLAMREDLKVVELHGNLETRLKKMELESLDGVVLAAAGLKRLGLEPRICQLFTTGEMVPAVCQGVLAVEARKDDEETLALLRKIDDPLTRAASDCERAFAEELGGDCYVPLGAFASPESGMLNALGMISDLDGRDSARASIRGEMADARGLGIKLAAKLNEAGGLRIMKELEA